TLALDGLGGTRFYQVYVVSAVVVLLVPPYNRLAERVSWRRLIPAVAAFFAVCLVAFRVFYREGSAVYGLVLYGWYDIFSAALVVQFFMTTQLFFNARSARQSYPLVIAGGSIGAALGAGVTSLLARPLGTPNLLLVAAVLIGLFAAGLPRAWPDEAAAVRRARNGAGEQGDLREVLANPHVRLIGATVLLTILVKQLVDYQWQTLSLAAYPDRDALASFQGMVLSATQWLPLVVLVVLRPALARWGVGFAVLLLPVFMLAGNFGLLVVPSLWIAVATMGAETSLRYSAERTGREILYVPVPDRIKMKAKVYIDLAVENGAKALGAGLIFLLTREAGLHLVPAAGVALSVAWLAAVFAVRREYVNTLSQAITGRYASIRGGFASLADASTLPLVRRALEAGDTLEANFALDLLEQAGASDIRPLVEPLLDLLEHPSPDVRARTLRVLARVPGCDGEERVRASLRDDSRPVREAAVLALVACHASDVEGLLRELLTAAGETRMATLACMARGEVAGPVAAAAGRWYLEQQGAAAWEGDTEARIEMALAAGTLGAGKESESLLSPLLGDPDARVRSAALRSAGMLQEPRFWPEMIRALDDRGTREAARAALLQQGTAVVEPLAEMLNDRTGDPQIRRNIPRVLAAIPGQRTVEALLDSFLAPETDQLLDYRALKGVSKLRKTHPDLAFDPELVQAAVDRETAAATLYLEARAALLRYEEGRPRVALLRRALREAWRARRETVFRCLGLIHDPDATYNCYLAFTTGDSTSRANALEWLEQTVGYLAFKTLEPVLFERRPSRAESLLLRIVLSELVHDNDTWLARCAVHAGDDLGIHIPAEPRVLTWPDTRPQGKETMDLIEKVFLLQQVDLLQDARSEHLALLASIAEESDVADDTVLLRRGQPTEALYVVIRGAVELTGVGDQVMVAKEGSPFGTWALIDEAPSLVGARTVEPTRLLRITRTDFYDLLADHPELAMGMLQGLARRVRTLVA
ncbi:MAG TPA: HEAT repeat domain-containing protein, partial [Longimicrobiales bacterium]|nr:HEAT repeat domain-containing protein [Longimicrobiales bacterium]